MTKFRKEYSITLISMLIGAFILPGFAYALRVPSYFQHFSQRGKTNKPEYFYYGLGTKYYQCFVSKTENPWELIPASRQKRNIEFALSIPRIKANLTEKFVVFNLGYGSNPLVSLDGYNCEVINIDAHYMGEWEPSEWADQVGARHEEAQITEIEKSVLWQSGMICRILFAEKPALQKHGPLLKEAKKSATSRYCINPWNTHGKS